MSPRARPVAEGTAGPVAEGTAGPVATHVAVIALAASDPAGALDRAHRDPRVAAIVLTGGCPPGRTVTLGAPSGKPVVHALSGPVDPATLALACRCDARVADDAATAATAGLAGAGLLPVLAGLVGPGRLPELVVAADLPAARMREFGLVSEVTSPAELINRAQSVARRLADLDPDSLAVLRDRHLPEPTHQPPAAAVGPPDLRVVPGNRSGPQTRQKILDAAAHVLRTRGYTSCRLADIAELCGTHQTSVYHYFRSKEALVDEVLRVGVTRTFDLVRASVEALPAEATALDRLAAAVRAHLRMVLVSGDYAAAAMSVTGELPKESYERIREIQHRYGRYWAGLYTEASDAGYLRPGVNLSVVRAFVAGALNYALEWYDPARGGVDELADEFLPMILCGLAEPDRVRGVDVTRIGCQPSAAAAGAEPDRTRNP